MEPRVCLTVRMLVLDVQTPIIQNKEMNRKNQGMYIQKHESLNHAVVMLELLLWAFKNFSKFYINISSYI